ncbi:hypothetical protein B0H14DRAFT_3034246, partial [Mycena olivaceomarginata]
MPGNKAFQDGNAVLVVTRGPGKMHVVSYGSSAQPTLSQVFGSTSTPAGTTERDETRFIITHSYTFAYCGFFWEGAGEAAYTIGDSLVRQAVGKSWQAAIIVEWGATTGDDSGCVGAGGVREGGKSCCLLRRSGVDV